MKARYQPSRGQDGLIVDQILTGGNMLSGGKLQDIHEISATQNYDIGTRWKIDDRTFHYCHAGTALTQMKAGHCGGLPTECNTAAVAYAIGDTVVTILDTTVRVANYYQNGYIWIMKSGSYQMHKIRSSAAGAGVSVALTLWEPLRVTIDASTWCTAWPNIYSNILGTSSSFMSNVAIPLVAITDGYYFWGQTWGPCFGTVMNTVPGRDAGQRDLYFHTDGALMAATDFDLTVVQPQRAGFLITNTTPGGAGYGDQFYMLQLSP